MADGARVLGELKQFSNPETPALLSILVSGR